MTETDEIKRLKEQNRLLVEIVAESHYGIDDHLPAGEGGNVGVLDAYPSGGSLVACPDPYAVKQASYTSDGVANVKEHVTDPQESRQDWTPTDGMLVERISDGECFRLCRTNGHDHRWNLNTLDECTGYRCISEDHLHAEFRPRCLREGDVVTKVKMRSGVIHVNEALISVDSDTAETDGYWFTTRDVLHIEGLGPVPWPPQAEEEV